MKLALSRERNVDVLKAEGPIAEHEAQILKAGITKLFKDGRNRIVIELPPGAGITSEALRELSGLEIFARELGGRIVLAGVDEPTRTRIEKFARPPVIRAYATREEAVEALSTPRAIDAGTGEKAAKDVGTGGPQGPENAVGSSGPTKTAGPGKPAKGDDPAAERAEIRQRELKDLLPLREALARSEAENQALKTLLTRALVLRRVPPDAQSASEKIAELESRIEKLLTELQKAPATPAKP